jgi:putative ABC transport system permease protein
MTFYLRYAARNVRRGGRWVALAVLCIAAGVGTVVSLRTLGLAIADSLVENVRIDNKGDLRLVKGNVSQFSAFIPNDSRFFSAEELSRISAWVNARGGRMTAFADDIRQIAAVDALRVGRPSFISTFYIDPATYPPSYTITALEPAGVPLAELFTGGREVVISQNMAEAQGLRVGDTVSISGTDEPFIVRGIVAADHEAGIRNLFGAFFGFAYVSLAEADGVIRDRIRPNSIAISLPDPPTTRAGFNALADELRRLNDPATGRMGIDTTFDMLERNAVISEVLGNFIVVLGLGALLIGGVGIMNTMLVMVRRRTAEISALKTFGLKNGQIARLFLAEGLLLGVLGSVLGSALGVALSGLVNRYGEAFLQQSLPVRVYPEALAYGVALGLLTTTVFSLVPILTALQVRPAQILRPNDLVLPRLGCFQMLLAMMLITLALGLIVGQIITPTFGVVNDLARGDLFDPAAPYITGVIGVAITMLLLGLLVGLLWWVVFFLSKLPSLRSVRLRLAIRNLANQRVRTATTILALSVGMFTLSVIAFVGEGTRQLLTVQLTQQVGGNVLALPIAPSALAPAGRLAIDLAMANVPDVRSRTIIGIHQSPLLAIDGRFTNTLTEPDAELALFIWGGLLMRDSTDPDFYNRAITIVQGRNLTPADRGRRVAVVPADSAATLGVTVGSMLGYTIDGQWMHFEVVGLAGGAGGGFFGLGGINIPPESLGGRQPLFTFYAFDVGPEGINRALLSLSSIRIPPTFALDVTFIDALVSRLINQFAAIPTVVALLSLLSAGVIMANTIALATLERRRQIGVLKALGLKGRTALVVMLIETSLISLTSAVLGLALSGLFLWLIGQISQTPIPLPASSQLLALGLLGAALLISVVATALSANLAARERVMNVLRYE